MPPDTDLFRPGSCAMRLTNIDTLPSRSKTSLINSIATDISATFIYIAKQAEAGNLSTIHTGPINDVIGIIKDTEVAHREALERKLARYKRVERRLRRERKWMRRELMGLTKKAREVVEDLKLKVHGVSEGAGGSQGRAGTREGAVCVHEDGRTEQKPEPGEEPSLIGEKQIPSGPV